MKNYDLFLKKIKDIEENYKCKKCGTITLVSTHFLESIFMCTKCGEFFYFNGVKNGKVQK